MLELYSKKIPYIKIRRKTFEFYVSQTPSLDQNQFKVWIHHTHIIWTKCYIDTIQPLHISDAFLTYVMYKCSKNRYGARAFFRFKEDNSSKSLENSMCCKQFFDVYSQTLISDFCSLYASKFSCIALWTKLVQIVAI